MTIKLKDKLYSKFGFYYALVDDELNLHMQDDYLCNYLSHPDYTECMHINELFPELMELNEEIKKVISGDISEFTLRTINRDSCNPICFNMYFLKYKYKNFHCALVVKDISEEIDSLRMMQQSRNEIFLLQDQLIELNNSLLMSHADSEILNIELDRKIKERTEELELNVKHTKTLFLQTVDTLTRTLEIKDLYTAGHQYRVSELAVAIAKKMNLDDDVIEGILIGSKLHDIGKIYVPTEFLTKPGNLREEEFEVIKIHTRMGFEIVKNIDFPWPIASIVLQHHENLDGSGYPFGISGDEILLEAKIVSVADIVEAMSTNRPYRISPGLEKALEELERNKGIKYDSQIAECCLELFRSGEFQWIESQKVMSADRRLL